VACVLDEADGLEPPVAVVLSGGNRDPLLTMRVLRHGMTAAGRYLSLHVRVPDRPGELARLLAELAATGANVLDVEHARTGRALHLDEVEFHLVL
jgi:threonine dehydratase